MCNAHNHPRNCNCGWGGVSYGNNFATIGFSHKQTTYVYPNSTSRFTSYLNPNANCPVCQCPVYFYQCVNGGRVFFDSLSPEWFKHPCTDNYQTVRLVKRKAKSKQKVNTTTIKSFTLTKVVVQYNTKESLLIGAWSSGYEVRLAVLRSDYQLMDINSPCTVKRTEGLGNFRLTTLDKMGNVIFIDAKLKL